MKKILIYLTGENGCTLHRLVLPYAYINKELFKVQFGLDKEKLRDTEEIKKYDAIVKIKGKNGKMERWGLKDGSLVLIE